MYAVLKVQQVVFFVQPEFIVNTVLKSMYDEFPQPFNATDNNFEIAVGYLSIRPYEYKKPDPRIGQINLRMVVMDQSNGQYITFTKHPLEIHDCITGHNFVKDESDSAFARNLEKFVCLESNDVEFQGTLVSPIHKYLHFEILACEEDVLR